MNPRTLTTVIMILIVGFSGGFLVGSRQPVPATGDDVAEATSALEELLAYRGTGARAARKTIDLVDTIVAGGPVMVRKIDTALGGISQHRYVSSGDQAPGVIEMDTLKGILSRHSTATIALLEALDRIGGTAAVQILMREAERQGRDVTAMDRVTSVLFLSKRGDRSEVRMFLSRIVDKYLADRKNDWETVRVLQVSARFLGPEMWDRVAGAFQTGWAADNLEDEIAYTLVQLDEKRASELFLSMLAEESMARPLRQASARSLGRMPTNRDPALELILRDPQPPIVGDFVRGLQHGRWDEHRVLWPDAMESGDPEKMKAYDLERLPLLVRSRDMIRRLEGVVGPEWSARLDLGKRIAEFTKIIEQAKKRYGVAD